MISLRWLVFITTVTGVYGSCATKEFMACVVQLNSQKVPFDTNVMNVVFNINTEAKLIHTCKTYEKIFPCFEQRLSICGSKPQKDLFDKGKRLHSYLCAPFSLQRQKILLRRSNCIQKTINAPVDTNCSVTDTMTRLKLSSCRSRCGDDLICNTKTDISQLAACTSQSIEEKCGIEAGQFYSQIQQVLTNREYPIQCSYHILGVPKPVIKPKPSDKITTKDFMTSSFITVYPQAKQTKPKTTIRWAPSKSRSRSNANVFASLSNSKNTVPTTTLSPIIVITPTTVVPQMRPIHVSTIPDVTTPTPRMYRPQQNEFTDPKSIPWYQKMKSEGSAPTNPMMAPFLDSGLSLSPPRQQNEIPEVARETTVLKNVYASDVTTPLPFKVNINWMDDTQTPSPWYQQKGPELRSDYPEAATSSNNPFAVVEPLFSQLRQQSLNLTEMGNQASNYFSAALNAISSAAQDTRDDLSQNNDPWKSLIDAVAPTIQKVSPEIIPRIRQEFEKLNPQ